MQENNTSTLLIIVSAVIALSIGVWFGFDSRKNEPVAEIQGFILPVSKTINEFNLTDNKNNSFNLQNLKNNWSLLFFGYTHCPDVCPTTLNTLKQVHNLMKQENIVAPQMVFISVDPERDRPEILTEYVSYFNKDFVGVTGEISELEKLASNLGVYFKKAAGSSGDVNEDDYLIDHTASFILTNPEGKVAAFIRPPHQPESIFKDLKTVIGL
jgi:protein SCO1/2